MSLAGVRLKIERAEEHVQQLQTEIRAVHDSNSYNIVRENNANTKTARWLVRLAPGFSIPARLGLLAGDAAHNLRSSLDYLACEAVRANHRQPTPKTDFPIWRIDSVPSAKELKALARKKVKGAAQDFVEAVGELQSYPTGNHSFLWELDHFDIIDKHRELLLVVGSYQAMRFDAGKYMESHFPDFGEIPSMEVGIRPAVRCPVQDGTELFQVPIVEAEHWNHVKFTLDVAFGEPGPFHCEPAVPRLTNLTQAVGSLVDVLGDLLT